MLTSKCKLLDLILKCNNLKSFKQIHALLITSSVINNDLVSTKVAEFFGKHVDFVNYACDFLNQIDSRLNTFPFNTLIASYAGGNAPHAAILVYRSIVKNGFVPDMYSFPPVLKACTRFGGIGEGKQFQGVIVKMGFTCDLYGQNALVHFYSVSGDCRSASKVFGEMSVKDVVSWTGMISGYVRADLFVEAITLFLIMDVEPNIATFVSMLVACGRLGYVNLGKGIHGLVYKHGVEVGLVVGNALIDMYVKCEFLSDAKLIFDELSERDIVSWTSLISGLVQCKLPKESLELFWDMQKHSGLEPDRIILTSVLSACASIGAFDYGRWVHEYIDRKGIEWDIHIGTAMVDMYAKCGSIELALQTFHGMPRKNVFTWNVMLGGLAMHGSGHEALKYVDQMVKFGIRPNEVTFLAILTACCHSGLVDEGRRYFNKMKTDQRLSLLPKLEHYGCMVDLLCKAGFLDEAMQLIKTMPMPPDVLIWGAFLSACKAIGNVELSQDILDCLLQHEAQDSGVFVLLSNIYASNERWYDVKRVRRLMKKRGIRKEPGSSVIEVAGEAHEFLVGDTSHPQSEDIHTLLDILANRAYIEEHCSQPFLS